MRVLIDSNGLQARTHAQDGKRLQTFLAQLEAMPLCSASFSPPQPLTADILGEHDVLVLTTRYGEAYPYSIEELTHIPNFVRHGGGLLLMSNHGDLPGHNPHDLTKHDAILARQFGIEIETSWFAHAERGALAELSGSALLATHPIIRGDAEAAPIRSIITNNCCSLRAAGGVPIITLTSQMIDHRNALSSHGRSFAIALDADARVTPGRRGRVVVVADSGFIGTAGTTVPGPGLIEQGDNRRFIQNVVCWLGRELL